MISCSRYSSCCYENRRFNQQDWSQPSHILTSRKILILSSIYSQVPQIVPSLIVAKQRLGRKVEYFLHNQWNSSIHESSIFLRNFGGKNIIILRCVRTQKTITLATSKVKAWKLVRDKPLLPLPSKLQHTACWIQPDMRRQRYIAHYFKPADKKKDSCFFYVSNKRQSNVIFTCIQNNAGLKEYLCYPNKKCGIRLPVCVLKLSSATHCSVPKYL
jgi:hypothetical protein